MRKGKQSVNEVNGGNMTGTIDALIAATVFFVAGHFALSTNPVRSGLIARLGDGPFMIVYSAITGAAFVWMLYAFGAAPFMPLWEVQPWTHWIPAVGVPISTFLVVCGLTSPNPGLVGGEASYDPDQGPKGIFTVSRHPMLLGFGIWAVAHIPPNGDVASLVFFGGLAILSFVGMRRIDAKRRETLGAAWGPFELSTSLIPFLAAIEGRTQIDWRGIGIQRVAVAAAVTAVLYWAHPFYAGVSPALVP